MASYTADAFIGTDLYAAADGVPAFRTAAKTSTGIVGYWTKGQRIGRVTSFIARGQGMYGTYDADYFQVLGNNGKENQTFFVPIVPGYFDRDVSVAQGVLSVEEKAAKEAAALADAKGPIQTAIDSLSSVNTYIKIAVGLVVATVVSQLLSSFKN